MNKNISEKINPDLERFVIYQIAVDNTLLNDIGTFESEYIYNSEYREIFKFILNKIDQGIRTTRLSIKEYYFETGHPIIAQEKYDMFIKGTDRIMAGATKSYAKEIRSLYAQRLMIEATDKTKQLIMGSVNYNVELMATQLIAKIEEVLKIVRDKTDNLDHEALHEMRNSAKFLKDQDGVYKKKTNYLSHEVKAFGVKTN